MELNSIRSSTSGFYTSAACGTLCASGIEAQEMCNVTSPVSWINGTRSSSEYTSFVIGCGCPVANVLKIERSVFPLLGGISDSEAVLLMIAIAVVAAMPLSCVAASWCVAFESSSRTAKRLGRSASAALFAAAVTIATLLAVAAIDWRVSLRMHANAAPPPPLGVDVCTYHGMFCEATRHRSFVRRPSNAYSNAGYLFVGMFILAAQPTLNAGCSWYYRVCDTLFALAIIALAIVSFLWHARNVNDPIHYLDLGTMESVIVYPQIRAAGLALQALLVRKFHAEPHRTAKRCAVLVVLLFAAFIFFQLDLNAARARDGAFEFFFPGGRARAGAVDQPSVAEVAALWAMPLGFAIPLIPVVAAVGSLGSIALVTVGLACLAVGWALHLLERFALDLFCLPVGGVLGFVTSPTGVFHALTGVTILTLYLYLLSLQATLEGKEDEEKKTR